MEIKKIGWLRGLNGVGVVYEIPVPGGYSLATIWEDSKFHTLKLEDFQNQVNKGTAVVTAGPLQASYLNSDAVGSVDVAGYARFYTQDQPETGTVTSETLEIPVKIAFEGVIKINLGGLTKLFEFLQ
jgi:hypothetical protein